MAIANLRSIILKVRKMTGSGTSDQLTDSQIIDYINSFYLYDFPSQYRALKLEDKYTFNTQANIDTYPFDSEHWSTVQMPCYCAKREIRLFQDPWSFYGVWFNWQQITNFTFGNGTIGPYTASGLAGVPMIRSVNNNPMVTTTLSSVLPFPQGVPPAFPQANISRVQNLLITTTATDGTTLNVTDDGDGNLIGDVTAGTNTINYITGAITLRFSKAVLAGANIQIQYNPVQPSIPLAIMFFQNQFTLRPVPNAGYTIELVGYRLPSQALLGTSNPDVPNLAGVPELAEWWECLAAGASKKVYEDRLDSDGIMLMDKMLQERYNVCETRTYAQLGKQSINTIFRDQLSFNYGSGGWGMGQGS